MEPAAQDAEKSQCGPINHEYHRIGIKILIKQVSLFYDLLPPLGVC